MIEPTANQIRTAVAAAAIMVAAVLAGCTTTTAGAPQRDPAPAPEVKVSALAQLMPPLAKSAAIMGSPEFSVGATYDQFDVVSGDTLSDPTCYGAVFAAAEPTYRNTGYTGVYGQRIGDPLNLNRRAEEAAVAFSSPVRAKQYVSQQKQAWQGCADKIVTVKVPDQRVTWTLRAPDEVHGVAVVFRSAEGQRGYGCSHALADRNNIVVDIGACSDQSATLNDQTAALAETILTKIPT